MSGLFGIDYEKEGRGVPEDGSKESGPVRFFKILQRKFWQMIKVNLMQALFSLPAFAVCAFVISYMFVGFMPNQVDYDLSIRVFIGFILVSLQLITLGPLQAGFIYVIRNYAREENAFAWSDFFKGVRENWKRALAVSGIDLLMVFAVSYMYLFYNTQQAAFGETGMIFKTILLIFGALYAMMHLYIFPMMVTLDLTVRQLYGNALRFAVAKFLPNAGILAISIIFGFIIFSNILVGLFAIALIGYSFIAFITTFYAYGAIDKYIIRKTA